MDVPSPSPSSSPSGRSENDSHVPLRRQTTKPPTDSATSLPLANMDGENEQSPLLAATHLSDEEEMIGDSEHPIPTNEILRNTSSSSSIAGTDTMNTEIPTRDWWFMFRLTACFFGLQIAWSVEQAEISPFLLELGISRKIMALIWVAGPLSGVVVQPYVGMKSDKCRSRFGKRRPFIVGGAIATIVSLMVLVWSSEITGGMLRIFGMERDSKGTRITSIVVAVLMLYVLDFSINVLQASARTLVVDSAPAEQQDLANAWATRVSGVGDIFGFMCAFLNLGRYLSALGDTQFKDLAFLTSIALAGSVALTVFSIPEKDARLAESPLTRTDLRSFFRDLWHCMHRLPPQVRRVCFVQLAAWIGWFPVLFYTTAWIRDIYLSPFLEEGQTLDPALSEHGTQLGSLGLLFRSVITLTCIVLLPWLVRRTPSLSLKRVWVASHLIFALLTGLTFLADSVSSAISITLCMGVPWAITLWVPFALIAAEMKKGGDDDENGAILGIHNMAIALPQVIAIIASSAIFQALDGEHGEVSPNTTAWVFRMGGVVALVAAFLALKVEDVKLS